jgi:hypothetical protein
MLSDQVASSQNFYQRVSAINDLYESAYKNAQEYAKPSMEMTEMMNQGQKVGTLYNAMGQPITGIDGQPVTFNVQKGVQSVMKEDDGSTTILYKDGTFENKKFGAQMDQATLQSYAQGIES